MQSQAELESVEGQGVVQTDALRAIYFQKLHSPKWDERLDRELVNQVLERAKRVISHPSRPMVQVFEELKSKPWGELALDESLEDNPLLSSDLPLLVEEKKEKPFSCVAMLDSSASMTGEKHLLASIAVAVLLLQVPPRDTSVVLFSSDAKSIKDLLVEEAREKTILNFLKQQPRGFTNIARGLEMGLGQLGRLGGSRRRRGLIATDGRSTEGGDPVEIARQFDSLVVLHLHGPGSHFEASEALAQAGNGVCLEVEQFQELPYRLYEALRILARG